MEMPFPSKVPPCFISSPVHFLLKYLIINTIYFYCMDLYHEKVTWGTSCTTSGQMVKVSRQMTRRLWHLILLISRSTISRQVQMKHILLYSKKLTSYKKFLSVLMCTCEQFVRGPPGQAEGTQGHPTALERPHSNICTAEHPVQQRSGASELRAVLIRTQRAPRCNPLAGPTLSWNHARHLRASLQWM